MAERPVAAIADPDGEMAARLVPGRRPVDTRGAGQRIRQPAGGRRARRLGRGGGGVRCAGRCRCRRHGARGRARGRLAHRRGGRRGRSGRGRGCARRHGRRGRHGRRRTGGRGYGARDDRPRCDDEPARGGEPPAVGGIDRDGPLPVQDEPAGRVDDGPPDRRRDRRPLEAGGIDEERARRELLRTGRGARRWRCRRGGREPVAAADPVAGSDPVGWAEVVGSSDAVGEADATGPVEPSVADGDALLPAEGAATRLPTSRLPAQPANTERWSVVTAVASAPPACQR